MKISSYLQIAIIFFAFCATKAQEPTTADKLVQNGKLLYEAGMLAEAEEYFKIALAQLQAESWPEPLNKTTFYYLERIREERLRRFFESQSNPQWKNAFPPLEVILSATNVANAQQPDKGSVFKALAELAEAQGLEKTNFTKYATAKAYASFCSGAYSRQIRMRGKTYLVVVETIDGISIPGLAGQQLVLLDSKGRILDRLQCHINSRYGVLRTKFYDRPQPDGAQIVLWVNTTNHYWHTIKHRDAEETFHVPERGPNEWNQTGLLRTTVENDRFEIILPKMHSPETHARL